MSTTGPLPQWTMAGYGGPYEADDPHGVTWRLWHVEEPQRGYLLAPAGITAAPEFVTGEHGLYHALDMAGMRIAADAVRGDPEGPRSSLTSLPAPPPPDPRPVPARNT